MKTMCVALLAVLLLALVFSSQVVVAQSNITIVAPSDSNSSKPQSGEANAAERTGGLTLLLLPLALGASLLQDWSQ